MLTVLFLLFVSFFLISGVFISLETKRRKSVPAGMKPVSLSSSRPQIGRAVQDDQ